MRVLFLALLLSGLCLATAHAGTRCQVIGSQIFCTTTGPFQPTTQTRCQVIGTQIFC